MPRRVALEWLVAGPVGFQAEVGSWSRQTSGFHSRPRYSGNIGRYRPVFP